MTAMVRKIYSSYLNSMMGFRAAWPDPSIRIEVVWFLLVLPLILLSDQGVAMKFIGLMIYSTMIAVELLNTALEEFCDRMIPQHDEAIGRVKDMGSAAGFMMISLSGAYLAWLLVAEF